MTRSAPLRVTLFALFLGLLASCGYTTKTVLPRNIKTIHIDTFQNKLSVAKLFPYEPGLEIKITNAVIQRLHQDGTLKVVSRSKADAVLEGDLISFDQEGVRFTNLERIEEYRLFIVTALRLRDAKTGELLWEEPNFSGDTSYFVQGNRAVSRGEAADRAIARLARNVVDRIVEDW